MHKLLTTAAVAGLAAGVLVAPQAAEAAGPQADQLILCGDPNTHPLTVTVENLTYDSTGPQQFTLTGACQTIVDGASAVTPISAGYRVAFEPATKNPSDLITILTDSGQTRTVQGEEATVQISSLAGMRVTFTTPD